MRLPRRAESGIALPELLVAITVIVGVLLASGLVLVNALRTQSENESRDRGVQFVREIIETTRALPYDEIYLDPTAYSEAVAQDPLDSYSSFPATGIVVTTGDGESKLVPWQEKDYEGKKYSLRTDVTWHNATGDNEEEATAKEITVTAYWNGGASSTSMTWIRTPSIGEATPGGIVIDGDITLNPPYDITYMYSPLGTEMTVQWMFDNAGLDDGDLTFEVWAGSDSSQSKVATVPGAARSAQNIPANGVTHLFVRAIYQGYFADSALIQLAPANVIEAPAPPEVTGVQVSGSTTARFDFTGSAGATTYFTMYRVNEGGWNNIGAAYAGAPWISEPYPNGAKVEFAVRAVNLAGSSEYAIATVNIVAAPLAPEILDAVQKRDVVEFTFDAVVGASSYQAQYRVNDGTWRNIANARSGEPIAVPGGDVDNVVDFRVRAVSTLAGPGNYANTTYVMLPPPPEPEILSAEQQPGVAVFTFDIANADATYEAQYRLGDGEWVDIDNPQPNEAVNVEWSGSSPQTIYFQVRALTEDTGYSGWSSASVDMLPPPPAPQITTAVQHGSDAQFRFEATARTEEYLVEYRIDSTSEEEWLPLEDAAPGQTLTIETVGGAGLKVEFRVRALNSTTGHSPYATAEVVMVDAPAAPEIDIAEQVMGQSKARFSFTSAEGADSYKAAYKVGSGEWVNVADATPGQFYIVEGTGAQDEDISFRVVAVNVAGESEEVEAMVTLTLPPDAPELHSVSQTVKKVVFQWTLPDGFENLEGSYRVNGGAWIAIDPADLDLELLVEPDEDGEGAVYADYADFVYNGDFGQTVELRVRAQNSAGYSPYMTASLVITGLPSGVEVTARQISYTQAGFTFSPAVAVGPGAISYKVEYKVNDSVWFPVNPTPAPNEEFSLYQDTFDTITVRVTPSTVAGDGTPATGVITLLSAPDPPVVHLDRSFDDPDSTIAIYTYSFEASQGATAYEWQRKIGNGPWSTIGNQQPGITSGSGSNSIFGSTVHVRARAYSEPLDEWSDWNEKSLVIISKPVVSNAPTTGASSATATVSGPTLGATAYEAQYKVNDGPWIAHSTNTTGVFTQSGVAGQTITWRIRGINPIGNSYGHWAESEGVVLLNATPAPEVSWWKDPTDTDDLLMYWSYQAVPGATQYEVERRNIGAGGTGNWIASSALPGVITTTYSGKAGAEYWARARAYVPETGWSEWNTQVLVNIKDATGTNTQVENTTQSRYTITELAGAEKYEARVKVNNGPWISYPLQTSNVFTYNASPGDTLVWEGRGYNSLGESYGRWKQSPSLTIVGAPAAPTWGSVSEVTPGSGITEHYFNAVDGATSYQLGWRLIGRDAEYNYNTFASIQPGEAARVTGVPAGSQIRMALKACNIAGCSPWTYNTATTAVKMTTASKENNANGTNGNTYQYFQGTSYSGGGVQYEVQWNYSASDPGTWKNHSVITTAGPYEAKVTGAGRGTWTQVRIRTIDTTGYGSPGPWVTAPQIHLAPASPTIPPGVDTSTGVTFTVPAVTGATSYKVQYRSANNTTWQNYNSTITPGANLPITSGKSNAWIEVQAKAVGPGGESEWGPVRRITNSGV